MDWQIYGMIEPFGDFAQIVGLGHLTTLTANINRGDKRKHKPFAMHEIFPLVPAPKRTQIDPEALAAMLSAIPGVTTRPATPDEIAELYGR